MKFDSGSSLYFMVALVVFEEQEETQTADDRIASVHCETSTTEFHFVTNSEAIRIHKTTFCKNRWTRKTSFQNNFSKSV